MFNTRHEKHGGLLHYPVMTAVKHPQNIKPPEPAPIARVQEDSAAAHAGVKAGWELLMVNGELIPDILAYRRELEKGVATLSVRNPQTQETITFTVALLCALTNANSVTFIRCQKGFVKAFT